ncbi:EMC3/TMCO1 family protein, partial [Nanoarchaeota archaeon]
MVFETLLDPIFNPLLALSPLWIMLILSFLVSALITLIYKFTTDQNLMKSLKEEIKEFQNEMKELKHDPSKMMEVQKKAMQTNMKYMMQSLKSTLFTF